MKSTDSARIRFLESTFANDRGDVVRVAEETAGEVYYYDSLRRWCYLKKTEEGTAYQYIPRGEKVQRCR